MPLSFVINRSEGEVYVALSNADDVDEARADTDDAEEFVGFLKFDDPFERENPMEVLSALFFHNLSEEGSLGRAMEHVLTKVLMKGMEIQRQRIRAEILGPDQPM